MKFLQIICILFFANTLFAFDFSKLVQTTKTALSQQNSSSLQSDGLKKALDIGSEVAVNSLSGSGYLNNDKVKIPLPSFMQNVANIASKVGAKQYIDNFTKDMNLAAGDAVKLSLGILKDAIKDMSIADAAKIVSSNDTAATQYFKSKTNDKILNKIKPNIEKSMAKNNVLTSYNSLMDTYGGKNIVQNLKGIPMLDKYMPKNDITSYISQKAIDGIFYMVAQEEKKIRSNPLSYGSDLIKKVFAK